MKNQNAPVQKNQTLTVTIDDLTHDGSGVAKVDGYALFVPQALPGETAKVKVIKTKKGYGFARLLEIEDASKHRSSLLAPSFINAEAAKRNIWITRPSFRQNKSK